MSTRPWTATSPPPDAGSGPRRVVLVGSSLFGSRAISRLGMAYLLVCDTDDDPALASADAESVVMMPYRDDPGTLLALPRPPGVQAVVSFTEYGLLAAAELAAAWSVGGVPVAAVRRSRDKLLMRGALATTGHPVPAGPLRDDADTYPRHYPVVVKPVSGVAGTGVQLVASRPDLAAVMSASSEPLMWEQYLPGAEFSVETITADGNHTVLGVTEKVTTGPPYFVEHAHFTPAPLTQEGHTQVTTCVLACLDAIGLTAGPAHTEVVQGPGGATVVETHTRPGGGRIPFITELVTGLDQYELAIRAACGLPMPAVPASAGAAGVRFLSSPPGVLTEIAGIDCARELEGVAEISISVTPGDRSRPWRDNLDRAGFAVCRGHDRNEVQARLDRVARAISFTVRDAPAPSALVLIDTAVRNRP